MLRQRDNTARVAPKVMYARYRGVCKCGRGFIAGEQIEFDPIGRNKRCFRCLQQNQSTQQEGQGELLHFDSYSGIVRRLKRIAEMSRPLAPHIQAEYWKLMQEISTASESTKSVTQYLQSTARCCSGDSREHYIVTLSEDRPCVHCFQMQNTGELVFMEFPKRSVHCIWCECTNP